MSWDVAIIGGGVVGTAIARELAGYRAALRPARGRRRRRHGHVQGEHGDPAHRVRRHARHAGEPPGGPGQRAAARVRGARRDRRRADRGPARRLDARAGGGPGRDRREIAGERVPASVRYCRRPRSTSGSPRLGPGALGGLWDPGRVGHRPVVGAARVRDRGGPRGRGPAAGHAGHRGVGLGCTAGFELAVEPARRAAGPLPVRGQRGRAGERRGGPDVRRRRLHHQAAQGRADRVSTSWPGRCCRRSSCRCRPRGPRGCWSRPPCSATCCSGRPRKTSPTAGDRSTSAAGLSALLAAGRRILPGLAGEEVTATYAGLRAATEHARLPDRPRSARYVRVAGIRSTGLTASLGIAEHVAGLLADGGPAAEAARGPARAGRSRAMPYLGEAGPRPYQDAERIAADPAYGEIACHCERVTRGEIRDALASDIPPAGARRAAAPDPRDERPLPGVLLRRGSRRLFEAGPHEPARASGTPGRGGRGRPRRRGRARPG